MDNLVAMAVFNSTDDLLEESACLILWHPPPVNDVLKQFTRSIL